jgi:hypothetical protein
MENVRTDPVPLEGPAGSARAGPATIDADGNGPVDTAAGASSGGKAGIALPKFNVTSGPGGFGELEIGFVTTSRNAARSAPQLW